MKNIKYFFFIFLLLQFSCVKDDTVYDPKGINDITIEDFARIYTIEIGEHLKIPAVVKTRLNDESNLTYVWYKYKDSQFVPDTLSYEKDLDVEIYDVLPGVETTIMLKVTDSKTGVYTRKGSKFITRGVYSDGTMILARNGNEYDLNFLKSKTGELRENVYSNTNDGEKLGEKSKMILFPDPDIRESVKFKAVMITSNDHTGGVYLDPILLKRTNYIRDKFVFPEELPDEIRITGYAADQQNDYLIINGKIYPRPIISTNGANPGNGQWYQELAVLTEPTDYSLSSAFSQAFSPPFYGAPLVYDNLNNRFMLTSSVKGYFNFLNSSYATGGKFDPNKIGKGLEMVISGSLNGNYDDSWALMKDTNTGEYVMISYLFIYNSVDGTYEMRTKSKTTISRASCPNLYNGTQLTSGSSTYVKNIPPWAAFVRGVSDFFFFLNNNQVYAFNAETIAEVSIIDGATYNYTITGIKCEQIPEPTDLNPDASYVRLGIAVKDNALSTKSAGVAFFKLSNLGGFTATKYYSKTGICDEIIDFKEKLD